MSATMAMSNALREQAAASGWPQELAASLGVRHEGGAYRVSIPRRHATAIMDLEYGTPTSPPSAVIRQFLNRADSIGAPHLQREALAYLDTLGLI